MKKDRRKNPPSIFNVMKPVNNFVAVTVLSLGLAIGADGQTNSAPSPTNTVPAVAWLRIVFDQDFKGVWANTEIAYQVAVASGTLGSGGDRDMLGFEGMMKYHANGPPTVDALTKKYGKPEKTVELDGKKWLDYGPIQFALNGDSKSVTTFRAQRGFYEYGFVKVAENTLKKRGESKPKYE